MLLYSSSGKGKKAVPGKGHSKSFKTHEEFEKHEGDLIQAALTVTVQEQNHNQLVQDQLNGKKLGVIATRHGLSEWRDNKALRQIVQERCKNLDHPTSWFVDALVRKFGVRVFILSINTYENDEDIYDGEQSVKHLTTDAALAQELEKELLESTGSGSSSGVSSPESSEVGNGDDIGDIADTLNDQLLCYYNDDKQQEIDELKTKLTTKSAEVEDLQEMRSTN